MTAWPDDIPLVYPVIIEPEWSTLISDVDVGGEQRRQKWLFAKYNVRFKCPRLSATQMQTVWDFYAASKGAHGAFYFFDPAPLIGITTSYKALYVGYGDETTSIFDLPGKSTSNRTLYINGTTQSSGFSYLTGGGSDGSDRVSFTSAPADGDIITVDFTGRLRVRCRFRDDRLPRELFIRKLFNFGIDLKGLGPE
jgi:hypothetical protein